MDSGSYFERIVAARALLFVPGDRPDRFDKAVASGADAVIVDLEDAVAEADKDAARSHVDDWLSRGGNALVRINAAGTPQFDADLELARKHGCPLMLPKAEDPRVLAEIDVPLVPIVETALGIEAATALCAVKNVARVAFGSVDLATQLGVRHDDELALGYARSRLVLASTANDVAPPLDGVTTDLHDESVLIADVAHARRLGFGGKLCIHPKQIPLVRQGFMPTEEELRWARRVLTAGDSASAVDGQMVDRPVLERARRLLAQDQRS
ncbi:HpcH/HpaI aldolase/citrate lyase family protein [Amycolatopsis pithecellobii]|uniref:CoA ester lyase n=1 Tax=Amycolatopsis pithecellobii TaxID=664692 RepID=A0A6N7YSH8_9PSEU|nr:CoA ester lyase [Amycolatopsis pithecellobii]MTD54902.1 CoA ester lyase [Amycolatopsis pithecellobii]